MEKKKRRVLDWLIIIFGGAFILVWGIIFIVKNSNPHDQNVALSRQLCDSLKEAAEAKKNAH